MSDPAAVRAHVDKILASPGFANADRLRRFLTFTTEAHLKGESEQIKEYVLGREVFDRDDNYDPRIDPIVRVEARRLRQRLAEYYAGDGRSESLRIEFPKGSYAPAIAPAKSDTTPRKRIYGRLILAAAVIAVAAAAWYFTRPSVPVNALAIVPARWTFLDSSGLDTADEAIAEAATKHVANRGKVPVIGWPSIIPFRAHNKPSLQVAKDTGAIYVLAISVRGNRVTCFLVEPYTGRKRWAEDFYEENLNSRAALDKLALTIAQDIEITLGYHQ